MTRDEYQIKWGFSDEDMTRIELAKSISDGKITEIWDMPLEYQDIKIKMDFKRKLLT